MQSLLGEPLRHGLLRGALGIAGALVAPLVYRLLRDRAGRDAALAAGLLCAFSFGLDVIATAATSEGLFLLLLLCLLLAVREEPSGSRSGVARGLGVGILGGLLALTRSEGILLAILIPVVWVAPLLRRRPRPALRRLAFVAAGIALALAPWTIRNAVRMSDWNETAGRRIGAELPTFIPITAYGPLNFALANNDLATGGFQRALLSSGRDRPVLELADPQHRHYFLHGTREGIEWIRSNPGAFARLAAAKLGIASRSLDLGWTPWNLPHGRAGTRLPVDVFAPASGGLRWFHLVAAAAGAALLLRRPKGGRLALLLFLPILGALVSTILFFGYVRLGLLAVPFLFAFEGVALAALARRIPERIRSALGRRAVAGGLIAAALLVLLWAGTQNRDYIASGTSDRPGGTLIRDAPIEIRPAE